MPNCSGGCGNGGDCSSCSGCGKKLELTISEIELLLTLGTIPFLPVARRADDMTPVCFDDTEHTPEECSLILQVLEKKHLITIDYDKPLIGADMTAYKGFPVHGSIALTARGQEVLDTIDIQGIAE